MRGWSLNSGFCDSHLLSVIVMSSFREGTNKQFQSPSPKFIRYGQQSLSKVWPISPCADVVCWQPPALSSAARRQTARGVMPSFPACTMPSCPQARKKTNNHKSFMVRTPANAEGSENRRCQSLLNSIVCFQESYSLSVPEPLILKTRKRCNSHSKPHEITAICSDFIVINERNLQQNLRFTLCDLKTQRFNKLSAIAIFGKLSLDFSSERCLFDIRPLLGPPDLPSAMGHGLVQKGAHRHEVLLWSPQSLHPFTVFVLSAFDATNHNSGSVSAEQHQSHISWWDCKPWRVGSAHLSVSITSARWARSGVVQPRTNWCSKVTNH